MVYLQSSVWLQGVLYVTLMSLVEFFFLSFSFPSAVRGLFFLLLRKVSYE